jgi:outer membrane protein OmpA-like peptidoglycan-associated protein
MPDSLLFDRGKAEIRDVGRTDLTKFIPLLAGVLCSPDTRGRVAGVVVEGHTDSTWNQVLVPPQTGPEKNLELSQSRSMEVVKASLRTLEGDQGRECFRQMLSASGRGQEEPLPAYSGDDAKQRRVVFKIRVQQDALGELAQAVIR